jgi:hypothetical protein
MAYAKLKHKYEDLIKYNKVTEWKWLIFEGWHLEPVRSKNCLVCGKPEKNHDRINLRGL